MGLRECNSPPQLPLALTWLRCDRAFLMRPMSIGHRPISLTFQGFCEAHGFNVKHFTYQTVPEWVANKQLSELAYATPPRSDIMTMLYGSPVLVKQVMCCEWVCTGHGLWGACKIASSQGKRFRPPRGRGRR